MHENIYSFEEFLNEFHSFASELNRAADVILFSETWFSATLVVVFRVTPAFIHIVLTKQEEVSLC